MSTWTDGHAGTVSLLVL